MKDDKINLEYDKNLNFCKYDKSYEVDHRLIEKFNLKYNEIRKLKYCFNIFSKETEAISNEVELIFKEMHGQVVNEYESLFLKDLELRVLKLVKHELKYYSSIKIKRDNDGSLAKKYYFLGNLSDRSIDTIKDFSRKKIKILQKKLKNGACTREELSFNSSLETGAIVRELNKEFKEQGVLKLVSSYMGAKYHITGLSLELSSSKLNWWKDSDNNELTSKTPYAHFDESIEHPKAIIYLTDVNNDNGPTSFYPGVYPKMNLNALQELIGRVVGSVGSENLKLSRYYNKKYHQTMSETFRMHFMRLPSILRFNSHFGWDVIPNSALEEYLVKIENKLTGVSGRYIVFDGAKLLHRGGLVKDGERVAIQVIFGPKISIIKRIVLKLKRIISKYRVM